MSRKQRGCFSGTSGPSPPCIRFSLDFGCILQTTHSMTLEHDTNAFACIAHTLTADRRTQEPPAQPDLGFGKGQGTNLDWASSNFTKCFCGKLVEVDRLGWIHAALPQNLHCCTSPLVQLNTFVLFVSQQLQIGRYQFSQ